MVGSNACRHLLLSLEGASLEGALFVDTASNAALTASLAASKG